MPFRDWLFRINDIIEAGLAIQKYTEGIQYDDFIADRKTVDAVIKNFIVIGEAATHIPDEICEKYAEIPWQDMRAMRNFVVHEYFGVSDKILWDTIQLDLNAVMPKLKEIATDKERENPNG